MSHTLELSPSAPELRKREDLNRVAAADSWRIPAGRPTTAAVSPAGYLPGWTTTSGTSPTGGPGTRTRTSRGAGSRPGASAGSTSPGRTAGSSATGTPAPTSPSSPGRRSSATSRCAAGRLPTTRPWPPTGPTGGASGHPRQRTRPPSGSCGRRTAAALAAENRSCPTGPSHATHLNGNSGSPRSGSRYASSTAPCKRAGGNGRSGSSSTRPATGSKPRQDTGSKSRRRRAAHAACLSRGAWKSGTPGSYDLVRD